MHTIAKRGWTRITLHATNQQVLQDTDGQPITGRYLRWRHEAGASDQVARLVLGGSLTDDVAPTVGTDVPVAPTASYHQVEDIQGFGAVAMLSDGTAFDVWVRVDQ